MMTLEQLAWVVEPLPARSRLAEVYPYLEPVAMDFGIWSPERETSWLAQLAHESDRFCALEEYASGRAYEGRGDLGNIEPGDGPRFKGRGLIQLTGRHNYGKYGAAMFGDPWYFISQPHLVAEPFEAVRVAGWFWATHGCNELADAGRFDLITRRINGGTNGWEERLWFWQRCQQVYGMPTYQ